MPYAKKPLLQIQNLSVRIQRGASAVRPVEGLDLSIAMGETFALVGESGCGKSMTAQALLRLLPFGGRIVAGRIDFLGQDLLALPESEMRQIRGGQIGMIFQEPGTSLNPVLTVGQQIGEVLTLHRGLRGAAVQEAGAALLSAVGIPDPVKRLADYPFQFSGGMKQRVMIAMALAGNPKFLIADEPTTALDVTIQAQVLALLERVQGEHRMGLLLITHDLGVVARMAHQVGVMYAGELVEVGSREGFFASPLHPYSRKLFAALPGEHRRARGLETLPGSVPALDGVFVGCRFAPRCAQALPKCHTQEPAWHTMAGQQVRCHLYEDAGQPVYFGDGTPPEGQSPRDAVLAPSSLLEVRGLCVHFPQRGSLFSSGSRVVRAVDGVDFTLRAGRTLALVGESGCGKTTVGKAILQLIRPTAGEVWLQGENIVGLPEKALGSARRAIQMIFQDPFASLNPRMRIREIIEEGMVSLGVEKDPATRRKTIEMLLTRMGLRANMADRYPHEFSGGQRQRIAIARVLAVSPKVVICDEPTSALDVSVQAQLLNLLGTLQSELGLAYLFITHNLAVVEYLAHDVAVMYLGRIVETGPLSRLLHATAHPYTQALLAAAPQIDEAVPRSVPLREGGDLPSPLAPPTGCHFHPRCPKATEICSKTYPEWQGILGEHRVRCHWPNRAKA